MKEMTNQVKEMWRPVVGYESQYLVSDIGRVKSIERLVPTHKTSFKRVRERILSQSWTKRGYCLVSLSINGKPKTFTVHFLALRAFRGQAPHPKMMGRHKDGNPKNNNLTNLVWGTASQNQKDRLKHGTDDNGEKSANAKLTWKDVDLIRKSTKTTHQLSKKLGVSQSTVWEALNFKTWRRKI